MWKQILFLFFQMCVCQTVFSQQYTDRVVLGDEKSENAHGFTTYCPDYVEVVSDGLLGEHGRSCLRYENNPYSGIYTGINGGEYSVVLKVDGSRQNYITAKYSGADTGFEIHYTADIDGKILSNIAQSLVQYSTTPKAPGAFLYRTYSIPRSETDGKSEVVVRIRSKGRYYQYGTPGVFTTYQRVLDQNMPPLYALYTHTNPSFAVPADEKQGVLPSYLDAPLKTGVETDLDKIKENAVATINGRIDNILNNTGYSKNTAGGIGILAATYSMPQYKAYKNPKVVDKIKWALDEMVRNNNNGKVTASSEWGGAFGKYGYAIYKVRNEISDEYLDESVDLGNGKKSRRQQWIDAIKASFDHGAFDRRTLSNQIAWATGQIYGASLGLYALDPVTYAEFPKVGYRIARESAGLEYFTGPLKSVEAPDPILGDYTDINGPCGAYYRAITSKGGGREFPGWVCPACYGYLWKNFFEMWDMMRYDPYIGDSVAGDPEFMKRIADYERLNASLSYPSIDADGNRAMLCHSVTCSRIIYEPGKVYYGDVCVAGLSHDEELIGHAWQAYEDRQHTWNTPEDGQIYALYTPQAIDSLKKYSSGREKLPFTPGEESTVVSDEENAMVAFSYGSDIIYVNFSNNMAQHITPQYTKAINFVADREVYYSSGLYSTVQTEPYNSAHRVTFPDHPLLAGGGTKIDLPSYNHTNGVYNDRQPFKDFYQLWYNKYLIGLNTGYYDDTAYDIDVPSELVGKTVYNLTTKENIVLGEKLSVPSKTVYVLYVGDIAGNNVKQVVSAGAVGDVSALKKRADELTVFLHEHADSVTLDGITLVNGLPYKEFTDFWRELTFANYAANCGNMPQSRLDSALVKLNEAYDALIASKQTGVRASMPGKIDLSNSIYSSGRFTLDKESGGAKNAYASCWIVPVHAEKEGYYTIVVEASTNLSESLKPNLNVTFFDERGYYKDSSVVVANDRSMIKVGSDNKKIQYTWNIYLNENENRLLKLSLTSKFSSIIIAQIDSVYTEYHDFSSPDYSWLFQVPASNEELYSLFERNFAGENPSSPWSFKTYDTNSGFYSSFNRFDDQAPKCEGQLAYYNQDEWLFVAKNGYVHALIETSPAIVFTAPNDGLYCVSTTVQRQSHSVDNCLYTRYRFAEGGIVDGITQIPKENFMFSDAYGHKFNNVPVSTEFYVNMKKGDAITFEEDVYTPNRISSGGTTWENLMVSRIPDNRAESAVLMNKDMYYDYYEIVGVEDVVDDESSISVQHADDGIAILSSADINAKIYTISGVLASSVRLHRGRNFLSFSKGVYVLKTDEKHTVKFVVY